MWVRRLGSIARQQLLRVQRARVVGLSSAGVFIQLGPVTDPAPEPEGEPPWVVFLSPGETPGPLTLNLPGEAAFYRRIRPADEMIVAPDEVSWPRLDASLVLSRAEIWQAPPVEQIPGVVFSPAARRSRLVEVVRLALAERPPSGWSALLPGQEAGPDGLPGQLPGQLLPAIREIQAALKANDGFGLARALGGLAGLGSGLTPSGDDLALGLLLATSRWGASLLPGFDRPELGGLVVQHARQATTALSASLIACAAQGQADPRLIAALDGILTGRPSPAECAAGLLGWGHSSGLDALLGMSLVI
jgi:hypothetical protein